MGGAEQMLRPTLGLKLGLSFLLTLAVLLVTGAFSLVGISQIDQRLERIVGQTWRASDTPDHISPRHKTRMFPHTGN